MPIKLSVEITSPLVEEDRDLLSGIAVMTLAIANHEMAKTAFPNAFGEEEAPTPEKRTRKTKVEAEISQPCAYVNPEDPTLICVGNVGHRGRHRFRVIPTGDPALAN